MLTWVHKRTIPTTADLVWALWSKPHECNHWDEGIEPVTLDGLFTGGTKGYFKPPGIFSRTLGCDIQKTLPYTLGKLSRPAEQMA